MSSLFNLNKNDFVRGAINAVFVAIVAVLWKGSQTGNFDVLQIDWASVLNAAVYGFIGYVGMHFTQDENGAVFGAIGGHKVE